MNMGDFGGVRDKWVCPNDRQLLLRAKLKTGWSVKTNFINSFEKPQHINEKEQEAIMRVIKRAENLEKVEQERVGRLVERLDNMKKNAMGNGTNQCVLCADEFGILGASPLLCNDCRKAVCTKCGVDTTSVQKEPLWLCKICAETRETWKKSGAWFYKGLPKYILPGKKSDQSKRGNQRTSDYQQQNTSSLVRSYNAWLQSKSRSNSDKDVTDSSDDELRTPKLSRRPTKQRYFSESVESNDSASSVCGGQPEIPKIVKDTTAFAYPSAETNFPTLPDNTIGEVVPAAYSREAKSPAKTNHESSDWYKPRRTADDLVTEKRYRGHNRQESVSARASSVDGKVPRLRTEELLPHLSEMSLTKGLSPEEAAVPEGTSTLEYSILYDPHNEALHCAIYRAKGLKTSGYECLADPFVRLQLLPTQDKSDKIRTRTVHKTLNPEFNETVAFFRITDYDMAKRALRLAVIDEDPFGNDVMGETRISLKKIRPLQKNHFHIYLDKSNEMEEDDQEHMRGQILLSLMYSSEQQTLIVGIVRCIDLLPRENCDPYIRIHLKPDYLRRRHKTATKKKTNAPEYNEEFVFEMKPHELSKRSLAISAWDKDYGRTDEYIGGLALGVQSKGERLSHWLDIVRNPNQRIERWHPLSNAVHID